MSGYGVTRRAGTWTAGTGMRDNACKRRMQEELGRNARRATRWKKIPPHRRRKTHEEAVGLVWGDAASGQEAGRCTGVANGVRKTHARGAGAKRSPCDGVRGTPSDSEEQPRPYPRSTEGGARVPQREGPSDRPDGRGPIKKGNLNKMFPRQIQRLIQQGVLGSTVAFLWNDRTHCVREGKQPLVQQRLSWLQVRSMLTQQFIGNASCSRAAHVLCNILLHSRSRSRPRSRTRTRSRTRSHTRSRTRSRTHPRSRSRT